MGDLKNSSDPRIQKLRDVIAKGEAFIGFLDKRGVDIEGPRDDINNAKSSFDGEDLARSYTLAQRGIKELIRLKAEAERPKEEPKKEPTPPPVEEPVIVEEEKKIEPPPHGAFRKAEARQRIVELYVAWGKPDQATKWRARSKPAER